MAFLGLPLNEQSWKQLTGGIIFHANTIAQFAQPNRHILPQLCVKHTFLTRRPHLHVFAAFVVISPGMITFDPANLHTLIK